MRLRRPPRAEGRGRQGARLPLAALHRPLHPQHARPLQGRSAQHGFGRLARGLQCRGSRGRQGALGLGHRATRPGRPKLAALLSGAEDDLLAFYRFPPSHWPKLRSTNNLERINKEIARRSNVVGIFPNDPAVIRLVGALLIEQNDEWLLTRGYLSQQSIALVLEDQGDGDGSEVATPEGREKCRRVRYTTTRDLTGVYPRNRERATARAVPGHP